MLELIQYIEVNWINWLFAGISLILANSCRSLSKRLNDEQKKDEAISRGVQSLLRDNIVQNYNKYQDRGYCPIYAKESIKRVYESYHDLGGNDVATKLYEKLLEMPEEKGE